MKTKLTERQLVQRSLYYDNLIVKLNGETETKKGKRIVEKYKKFINNNFNSLEEYKTLIENIKKIGVNKFLRKTKKEYYDSNLRSFKVIYADLKMGYLNEEEFQAMKYYEILITQKKFLKKGKTLKMKREEVTKKYNIDEKRLLSIWSSRCRHMGYAKKEYEKMSLPSI